MASPPSKASTSGAGEARPAGEGEAGEEGDEAGEEVELPAQMDGHEHVGTRVVHHLMVRYI